MRITVITGSTGRIIGAFQGHAYDLRGVPGQLSARPVPGPRQKFHEIEADDDVFPATISAAGLAELPKRLRAYLPKAPSRRRARGKR